MIDKKEGPLSSQELERDRASSDSGTMLTESDAPGHTLPASESDSAATRDEDKGSETVPGPISGTMLPPD